MSNNVEKRFLSLLLAFIMVFSMFPWWTVDVGAASSRTETGAIGYIGVNAIIPTNSDNGADLGRFSINGNTINASAQSEPEYVPESSGACGSTNPAEWKFNPTTITITFTNNSGSDAIIGFSFSADQEVTIAGAKMGASGTYVSSKIAAGGTLQVSMKSGSEGSGDINDSTSGVGKTYKLALSNIYLQVKEEFTLKFGEPVNCTYQVDSANVVVGESKVVDTTQDIVLSATSTVSGYVFAGWKDLETDTFLALEANSTIKIKRNVTLCPIYVADSNLNYIAFATSLDHAAKFSTLDDAISAASTASGSVIAPTTNVTINKEYTIPVGVTLLIPRDDAYTLYTTTPEVVDDQTLVMPEIFRSLTMASGSKLTVYGNISVAGVQSAVQRYNGCPSGPLGYIIMDAGSNITLKSGSNLYAWGYVVGKGTVDAEADATVYECFQMTDFRGGNCLIAGGNALEVFSGKGMIYDPNGYRIFPMSQYYIQNIEVLLTLNSGATVKAHMSSNAGGLVTTEIAGATIPIISDSNEAMFQLTSGTISKDFNESTGKLDFVIKDGTVSVNPIDMSMQLMGMGVTINSSDFVLPIPLRQQVTQQLR